jgi:hypothetical protein
MTEYELRQLIALGEGQTMEFKQTLSDDKRMGIGK